MISRWRDRGLAWGGAAMAVVGGVATNRVEGAWWAQALWFAGAVAAAGTATWLQIRTRPAAGQPTKPPSIQDTITVRATGKAAAGPGGKANTGLIASNSSSRPSRITVTDTGDADASDDGDANTGVRL